MVCCMMLLLLRDTSAQTATWSTKAPMPTSRCCVAAGAINGIIYVVGGEIPAGGPNIALSTVEAYDPKTNSWTAKSPMPTPRYYPGAGVLNGVLYIVGGLGTSNFATNVVEAYEPRTGAWATKAPLPTARAGVAVAAVDGTLYAIGGVEIGYFTNTNYRVVEAYNPITNTWVQKSPMPTARCCMAIAVIDGLVYVAGGTRSAGHSVSESSASLEVYDPKTDSWLTKAPMPIGRGSVAGGVVDRLFYVAGGTLDGSTASIQSRVEAYDPSSNSWNLRTPMPTSRAAAGAAAVDDTLYVIGGLSYGANVLNVNEAFAPFIRIAIDIKPGDPKNTINLTSGGDLQVAIFSSLTFSASTIDPTTARLAGAAPGTQGNGRPESSFADVNRDGLPDLLLRFGIRNLQLSSTATEAVVKATTYSGQRIRGVDSIRVVH
jgi:N-acetylneuraminic acid mutarotase